MRPLKRLSAHSELSVGDYHSLADDTMDTLLDQLEVLVDSLDNPKYEVEYSVSAECCTVVAGALTPDHGRVAY